jgi:hypothetical protein
MNGELQYNVEMLCRIIGVLSKNFHGMTDTKIALGLYRTQFIYILFSDSVSSPTFIA